MHIVWFTDLFYLFPPTYLLASISLAKAGAGTAPLSLLLISLAYLSAEDNVSEHACAHGLACHQIQIATLPASYQHPGAFCTLDTCTHPQRNLYPV